MGACNAVAVGALRAMATRAPGWCQFAWVHGSVGTGKSAALLAACKAGQGTFTTCEEWANGWIQALKEGTLRDFRRDYCRPGTLRAFDDVEFLAGREKVQREFESLLERAVMAGGRVVVSARTSVGGLEGISPRLHSIISQAFVARLDRPGPDVVVALVERTFKQASMTPEPGVLAQFADRRWLSFRDVVGAANGLLASVRLAGVPQLDAARAAVRPPWRTPLPQAMLDVVAREFGIKCDDMLGAGRRASVTVARHVAMLLLHEECHMAQAEVARFMGVDHATVRNGLYRASSGRNMEPWQVAAVGRVRDMVASGEVA